MSRLALNTNVSFVESGHSADHQRNATLSNGIEDGNRVYTSRNTNRRRIERIPDYNPANLAASGYAIYLSNTQNHFAAITVSPLGRVRTWTSTSANGATWK